MRAYTITTKSRSRAKAWHRVLALTLSACALAIPATASGNLSPVNAITGGSSDSSKPIDGWNYSILNSPASPQSAPSKSSPQSGPGSSPQVAERDRRSASRSIHGRDARRRAAVRPKRRVRLA